MPDHLRPSAVPRRRATLLALLLLALAALGAAITVWAQDNSVTPGPEWVPADAIVGPQCVPVSPYRSDCFATLVTAKGLYEKFTMAIPVSSSRDPQRPSSPPIASGRDRPECKVDGKFVFYPAGAWHYGQYWTKEITWQHTVLPGYEGVPEEYRQYRVTFTTDWVATSNPTYAFFPDDGCEVVPEWIPTVTPTGGGNGTPTVPPGADITVTPTLFERPPRTPTPPPPTAPPTATPRPCIPSPIDPVPLTLFVGTTNHYNNNGQPFTRYGAGTCRALGDSRYCDTNGWRFSGAIGTKYYDVASWGEMIHGDLTSIDNIAQVRDLWTQVPANVVVEARYHFEFGRRMFDNSTVTRSRGAMVILQDLGADMRPGGGDDRLLAFLAMGDADLQNNPGKRHLKVQGTSLDSWPRLNLPGRPSGWQALLAPGVQVWSNAFFSWQGNRTPPYAWQSWPQPEGRDANGSLTRHAQDWLYTNDAGTNHGPLGLRFITERGRAYRMVMLNSVPGCNADMLHNISQLYFVTDPGANVAVEKQAPARAARNQMVGYSLTVRNTSQTTVNNVVLTDTLPLGMPFGEADLTLRDPITGETTTARVTATVSLDPSWTDGRTLVWNLGDLAPGETRSIALTVPATNAAPDAATNVAVVSAANDGNPNDNRAEATTVFVRTNVRVRITTPRIVRPGQEFETVISYENTSPEDATNVLLDYQVVPNVTIVGATPGHQEMNNERPVWRLGTVAAGQRGTVRVRVQVPPADSPALPVAVLHLARISADADADPMDNAAQATTTVLVVPPPQRGEERLRIHSEFDPERGVYLSEGTTVTWPSGEVMDFTPFIAPDNRQVGLPYYRLDRRVVAWSFLGSGDINVSSAGCKAREEPTAQDTQHADLSRMRGCIYRYRVSPSSAQMRWQGHLFWGQHPPERMRQDVYVRTPLPTGGTNLRIQYAVLTEVVETGYFDIDEDGRTDSVLERRTDVFEATYRVELVVPRDAR
jgi:uncharacterized repeat protein (TIGR01451 family)